jgi:enoyl-CoA hydratase/carnithine racemase
LKGIIKGCINKIEGGVMDKITFSMEGNLGIVTINDPPLNLLDQELIDDLQTVIDTNQPSRSSAP